MEQAWTRAGRRGWAMPKNRARKVSTPKGHSLRTCASRVFVGCDISVKLSVSLFFAPESPPVGSDCESSGARCVSASWNGSCPASRRACPCMDWWAVCHLVSWGMRIAAPDVMRTAPRDYYVRVQKMGVRLPWPKRARLPRAWELERDAYLAARLRDSVDCLGESETS